MKSPEGATAAIGTLATRGASNCHGVLLQACLDHTFQMKRASCLVNPRAGYETELNYTPTLSPKTVAVVGSGPAGLACATVAAQRGHKVRMRQSFVSLARKQAPHVRQRARMHGSPHAPSPAGSVTYSRTLCRLVTP